MFAVPTAVQSAAPAPQQNAEGGGATAATVVKTSRVAPPRRKVVRKRFSPWAKPSPRRVRQIIRWEAKRWGISASRLARRVGCESGFRWYAGNGAYQGLLQFASGTFYRGMSSIKSRGVKIKRVRKRERPRGARVALLGRHRGPQEGRQARPARDVHVQGPLPAQPVCDACVGSAPHWRSGHCRPECCVVGRVGLPGVAP